MNKRYILYSRIKDKKYEGYYRYAFKLFDNYLELQRHLKSFSFVEKNNYVVFEETEIKREFYNNDNVRLK